MQKQIIATPLAPEPVCPASKLSVLKSRKCLLVFTALLLAVPLLALLLSQQRELLTARLRGGKLCFAWPIEAGQSFEMTFTHSLNLSPITETIEWTGNELMVRKSLFKTFGAGVPVLSDGIGKQLVQFDDHFELLGIDAPMGSFTVVTHYIPNHRISMGEREVFLLDMAGAGVPVVIEVERLSILSSLCVNYRKQ